MPELTALRRAHIAEFGVGKDGRLFRGFRVDELPPVTVRRVWDQARRAALTEAEYRSPLRRVPTTSAMRVCQRGSTGSGPTQAAEWAGHSLSVLQRIYAKCLVGQDADAKRRIIQALRN